MSVTGAGYRVIGIRHALKKFKSAGLVEQDSLYPQQAVQDVQSEILSAAKRWYKIGARRGALQTLEAFLDGDFEVRINKDGKREIIAKKESVLWNKRLNVTVGGSKQQVQKRKYELTLQDLEFDV